MIIFIGAIVLIVVGILLCVFGYKTEIIKYSWETQTRTNKVETWRVFAGVVISGVCGAIVFGSLIAFACVHLPKQKDYEKKLYERQVLEYRLENKGNNIVGNELLYGDIVEFNNELRDIKYCATSPFLNWYVNELIAGIDYIEVIKE